MQALTITRPTRPATRVTGPHAVRLWRQTNVTAAAPSRLARQSSLTCPATSGLSGLAREFFQFLEIVDDGKVLLKFIEALADLLDLFLIQVSQELPGGSEIIDFLRLKRHQSGGGGVDRNKIVTENQHAAALCLALQRAIALHADDAVDDGELRQGQRAVDVENAIVDALPMQD